MTRDVASRERIRIDLEALPDSEAPVGRRLARLLKAALRQYGFRCLRVADLETDVEIPREEADA